MGAKSRRIGADAERAVVNHAKARGVPALRMIRTGSATTDDPGDVHLGHPDSGLIVVQVKAGKAAASPSEAQLGIWWAEADKQASTVPAADMAVLVWQAGRPMTRPGEWMAMLRLADVGWLDARVNLSPTLVRLPYGSLIGLLAGAR